jgi:hypothetical protein
VHTTREPRETRERIAVHFWPGKTKAHHTPGAVVACRQRHEGAPVATPHLSAVTCRKCLKSPAYRYLEGHGVDLVELDPPALENLGLLVPGSPPPEPEAAPYRNPRLRRRSDPLSDLVAGWFDLAEGKVTPTGGPLTILERAAYAACAKELEDRIATLTRGGL